MAVAGPGQLNLYESPSWGSRSVDCFEKLEQIGEGTYGQVYMAKEIKTGEIVALKKIRMDNEREGFPITAIREIKILKKLHHENVIKMKEIVTSPGPEREEQGRPDGNKYRGGIYMVFEYMDHDLTGLSDRPGMRFLVPQIKCYMKQLLTGLHYCHVNQVLHRDIKGSNLLIDNEGNLKLADFGLARSFSNDHNGNLTNRVITLWYRPPELLLGTTKYGPAVDMWSVGCIFAELLQGKPILPGKDEPEQLNKIFDLCGAPDEVNWPGVSKLPWYNNFKPSRPMKRRVREVFRQFDRHAVELLERMLTLDPSQRISAKDALDAEYFWTDPLPCDPRSLPKYESSHEFQTKKKRQQQRQQEEQAKRQKLQHPQQHSRLPPVQTGQVHPQFRPGPNQPMHPQQAPVPPGPHYQKPRPSGGPNRYPQGGNPGGGYNPNRGGQGGGYSGGPYQQQGRGPQYAAGGMPNQGPRGSGSGYGFNAPNHPQGGSYGGSGGGRAQSLTLLLSLTPIPNRFSLHTDFSILSAMQGGLAIDEPIRLASVLTTSKRGYISHLTKIVGTLGPKSHSVEVLENCLKAGMSVARFDFSWADAQYHQETVDNLRVAGKNVDKLCAVMLDTMGPELQVYNKFMHPIELKADGHVTITPDASKEPSSEVLPVNYAGLSKAVIKGDTIFVGQYLFTGSETTSVWLEVLEINGSDVICLVKNSATLAGNIFTLHVSQVHMDLPTLTESDKQVISSWGSQNKVDFISLSYTRHAEDVRTLKAFLKAQNLDEAQIFAKIENVEGLKHFDEILQEADGIILSRGNLGIDLPPEKVFLFQKAAIHKCNMMGKPAIITRVVDTMTDNLRPTRAEATDVANAVLDGTDGILLGAETVRGLYPIDAIKTVGRICAEAESVYNQSLSYKRILKHVGESVSHLESVASSAVRTSNSVKAAIILVFTSSGRAARLVAKYRPSVPVVAVVMPQVKTSSSEPSYSGTSQARQCLGVRGIYPILAGPDVPTSGAGREEAGLKLAMDHGKAVGLLKPNDQIVVFQKIGESAVVKIVQVLE